tara:strand:+ start:107 stop:301 length:195 start_codon:yes stop_codon:yes gene_type:complete
MDTVTQIPSTSLFQFFMPKHHEKTKNMTSEEYEEWCDYFRDLFADEVSQMYNEFVEDNECYMKK